MRQTPSLRSRVPRVVFRAHSWRNDHIWVCYKNGRNLSSAPARYVGVKGQGPTPPNVYRLVPRDRLFHGVRAIRLVPVDEDKMFGRAGILAPPYMLGPKGESNGCVAVRDYPVFLNAFLRGEVDRLVVINHFEGEPTADAGLEWLPSFIRKFLTPS